MFFIESFGFGRGLGALDLRETKFKKDFKILNPELLSDAKYFGKKFKDFYHVCPSDYIKSIVG